jgi:hypothetical protein
LVIESDPKTVSMIDEVLVVMDHEYKVADCLLEARRLIREGCYDYVLLAAMLSARSGGTLLVSNSHRTLSELSAVRDGKMEPVIVLLPPEDGYPEPTKRAAIRMAHGFTSRGAADFIDKPFPTAGRTLDRVIEKVMALQRVTVHVPPVPAIRGTTAPNRAVSPNPRAEPAETKKEPPAKLEAGTVADRWSSVPNEPIDLDDFMAKFCDQRTKENRACRKRALLAAARHETVTLPPLAGARKHGQSNKYSTHDLLAAWQGYIDEGVDVPQLLSQYEAGDGAAGRAA